MRVYGSKGSGQDDFEFDGNEERMRRDPDGKTTPGHDLWEFPSSSASNDPLGPRRELGSTRVKSRNAVGETISSNSAQRPTGGESDAVVVSHDTNEVLIQNGGINGLINSGIGGMKVPQDRSLKRGSTLGDIYIDPTGASSVATMTGIVHSVNTSDFLPQTSFRIDLTDPTLILTSSQKEQYRLMSATNSTAGSLLPPLADDTAFINPYEKFSDELSTIPFSTPLKQVQNGEVGFGVTSPLSEYRTSPLMSGSTVPVQTPSEASQIGLRSSRTSRRSKSTMGLQSPTHDKSISSTTKKAQTSIPTAKPKRRSKTSTGVSSQHLAENVALEDLSLPASVHEVTSVTAQRSSKKRKAKADCEDNKGDELVSDDNSIGLPKEQYKPRPSRSRGNTSVDGILENVDFSKRPEAQVKAKNKRRKTQESNVQITAKDAPPVQAEQGKEGGIIEHSADRTHGAVSESNDTGLLSKDKAEEIEIESHPTQKPPRAAKRKLSVDAETETQVTNSDAHAPEASEATARPTNPEVKKPAPKGRGRPRKKTEEKVLQPSETPLPEDTIRQGQELDTAPGSASQLAKDDKKNDNDTVLEETSINSARKEPPRTPQKEPRPQKEKGPDKHSPLNSGKVPYRVGLSKRARIEPLLRVMKK